MTSSWPSLYLTNCVLRGEWTRCGCVCRILAFIKCSIASCHHYYLEQMFLARIVIVKEKLVTLLNSPKSFCFCCKIYCMRAQINLVSYSDPSPGIWGLPCKSGWGEGLESYWTLRKRTFGGSFGVSYEWMSLWFGWILNKQRRSKKC